jgi:hypothetical protein
MAIYVLATLMQYVLESKVTSHIFGFSSTESKSLVTTSSANSKHQGDIALHVPCDLTHNQSKKVRTQRWPLM